MRDLDAPASVDALKDVRDGKNKTRLSRKQQETTKEDIDQTTTAWFTPSGLRRRLSQPVNFLNDQLGPAESNVQDPSTSQDERTRLQRLTWGAGVATVVLAVILAVVASRGAVPARRETAVRTNVGDLATWQELSRSGVDIPAADGILLAQPDLSAYARMPTVQTARVDPSNLPGAADPLDALDINCDLDASQPACLAAAAVNQYDQGLGTDTLSAEYFQVLAAADGEAADMQPGTAVTTDLDGLDLDCIATPAACEFAASVNSYEGEPAEAASDWLSERQQATRYSEPQAAVPQDLDTLNVDCSIPGHEAACAAIMGVNSYEGQESALERRRVVEEAGAQHAGVSLLEVDCGSTEEGMQQECEAIRAANSYETIGEPAAADQEEQGEQEAGDEAVADHDCNQHNAEASVQYMAYGIAPRTVGYDVPATEWDPLGARLPSAPAEAADHKDMQQPDAAAHSHAVHSGATAQGGHLADKAAGGWDRAHTYHAGGSEARTPGFDVPVAETAASKWPRGAKVYKNPANNPASRMYYKNKNNIPGVRTYYKNPLNQPSPSVPEVTEPKPEPASQWPLTLAYGLLYALIGLVSGLVLFQNRQQQQQQQHQQAETMDRAELLTPSPVPAASPHLLSEAIPDTPRSGGMDSPRRLVKPKMTTADDQTDGVANGLDSPRVARAMTPVDRVRSRTPVNMRG